MKVQEIAQLLEEARVLEGKEQFVESVQASYQVIRDVYESLLETKGIETKKIDKEDLSDKMKEEFKEYPNIIGAVSKVNDVIRKYDYDFKEPFTKTDAKSMVMYSYYMMYEYGEYIKSKVGEVDG
ncbi:MAG: hypothetical protein RSD13_06600 [Clostridium sp.]